MGQTVQQRAGEARVAKDLGPFGEGQVGGHDQRTPQVLLADEGEEHLRSTPAEGHEADFVQDDQLLLRQAALQFTQSVGLLSFQQLIDQPGGGVETHPVPVLTGSQAQSDGDLHLPGADGADQSHILAPLDVLAAGQVQHLGLLQAGDGREVELIQGAQEGEAGFAHPPLAAVDLPLVGLVFQEGQQVLLVGLPALGGLLGELAVVGRHRGQAQLTQQKGQTDADMFFLVHSDHLLSPIY